MVPRRTLLAAATLLGACSQRGASGRRGDGEQGGALRGAHWPGGRAAWRLAPPDGPPRALVVALHGKGGDVDSAFDLGFHHHLRGTGLALVSVSGGNGYWHARQDGTDSGRAVLEQLIPTARRAAGLSATARVGFIGYSMGGFGSLYLARRLGAHRTLGVATMSAALWTSAADTAPGAYDGPEDFRRCNVFTHLPELWGVPVRTACGTGDPFIAANRKLVARRPRTAPTFDPGNHNDAYWSSHAGPLIRWLATRS